MRATKHLALDDTNTAQKILMMSHTYTFGGALSPYVESWGAPAPLALPSAATVNAYLKEDVTSLVVTIY